MGGGEGKWGGDVIDGRSSDIISIYASRLDTDSGQTIRK